MMIDAQVIFVFCNKLFELLGTNNSEEFKESHFTQDFEQNHDIEEIAPHHDIEEVNTGNKRRSKYDKFILI